MFWRRRSVVLFSCCLLAFTACKSASKGQPYQDPEGALGVEFPIKDAINDRSRTDNGVEIHSHEVHDALGHSYRVSWNTADAGTPAEQTFDGIAERLRTQGYEISSTSAKPLGAVPGREYRWHTSQGGLEAAGITHAYLRGDRFYQLIALSPMSAANDDFRTDADHFFDSFRLDAPH